MSLSGALSWVTNATPSVPHTPIVVYPALCRRRRGIKRGGTKRLDRFPGSLDHTIAHSFSSLQGTAIQAGRPSDVCSHSASLSLFSRSWALSISACRARVGCTLPYLDGLECILDLIEPPLWREDCEVPVVLRPASRHGVDLR